MLDINELINAENIATYYNESNASQAGYLGVALFPSTKQVGLDLELVQGRSGFPVILKNAAFDANAPLRGRLGFERVQSTMPFFRERMIIGEKERQEILKASTSALVKPFIQRIFDDVTNLVKSADVIRELMIMQLISTGKIAILNNGIATDYDYQLNKKQFVAPDVPWSDTATSKPLKDLKRWQTIGKKLGFTVKRAIVSTNTWQLLLDNDSIKKDMFLANTLAGAADVTAFDVTDDQLRAYIQRKVGITIAEYSEMYTEKVGGDPKQFYPDKKITLMVEGGLGNTVYGTTPEEADLMTGASIAKTSIVNTGVAITTLAIPHPVNTETIVSAVQMPAFNVAGGQILIGTIA